MANVTVAEVKAWLADTKLATDDFALDTELEKQISRQVLIPLKAAYDTTTWVNESTTPDLVRSIISMVYAAWYYDRQYSDDGDDTDNYPKMLRKTAADLLLGIQRGVIDLPDVGLLPEGIGQPSFFPTDLSSSQCPTSTEPSNGPPVFMMGAIF